MSIITDVSTSSQHALLQLPDCGAGGLIYIAQVAANHGASCLKKPSINYLSYSAENKRALIWRPDCKLWSCPVCGEQKRRRLVARGYFGASQLLDQGRSLAFITVTAHERLGAAQSVRVWPLAWHKLHHRLRRASPDVQYLFVPELHKDGRMHAHGIMSAAPSRRWFKDNARECGFGYQNDMVEAESLRVVGYMAKYSAKCLENESFPRGTRRFRASLGWPAKTNIAGATDVVTMKLPVDAPLMAVSTKWANDGFTVVTQYDANYWTWLVEQNDSDVT